MRRTEIIKEAKFMRKNIEMANLSRELPNLYLLCVLPQNHRFQVCRG